MADYVSNYTGQQIDGAIYKVLNPDSSPASGSDNLVKSGGVANALEQKASASDVNALQQTVNTQGVKITTIEGKIPSGASSSNKLVTESDISGFITKSVDDLTNYYTKSQTYTKTEVETLISGIKQFTYEVVSVLPTASAETMYCIYFVPAEKQVTRNTKDEYITVRSGEEGSYTYSWEKIGSTELELSVAPGISEGIADTISNGTQQVFSFRKSGGDGVNYMKRIKGNTIVESGQLLNNTAKALETVGFNQWDEQWRLGSEYGNLESKNPIPVIPNTDYYFYQTDDLGFGRGILWYDEDGNLIRVDFINNGILTSPQNAASVMFGFADEYGAVYKHDICINISDPAKNGTYEPYWKRELPLNIESIRVKDPNNPGGILTIQQPMKSAGSVRNEIKDGKFYNRVDVRAYQSGDENDSTVVTDGTNTNYELATEEVYELADEIPNAIMCDKDGTERVIYPANTMGAPFCCDSNYSISVKNLLAKLNSIT